MALSCQYGLQSREPTAELREIARVLCWLKDCLWLTDHWEALAWELRKEGNAQEMRVFFHGAHCSSYLLTSASKFQSFNARVTVLFLVVGIPASLLQCLQLLLRSVVTSALLSLWRKFLSSSPWAPKPIWFSYPFPSWNSPSPCHHHHLFFLFFPVFTLSWSFFPPTILSTVS